jgi:two-component system, NarL family, nitrate/nitrite response regulator NarL
LLLIPIFLVLSVNTMIKIIIADDHQMVIDGLKALLVSEPDICIIGEAVNGEALLELLRIKEQPNLVILDINMPGLDGLEAAKEIHRRFPAIRILVLSMYNKPVFIKNLIEVGVAGYILKNTGREELINAIHKIAAGQDYFGTEVTKSIMSSLKGNAEIQAPLTKREEEVVKLIAKAYTTAEIAEKLFISTHTVDTHRKNLLSKLNLKNTAAIVTYAIQNGLTEEKF